MNIRLINSWLPQGLTWFVKHHFRFDIIVDKRLAIVEQQLLGIVRYQYHVERVVYETWLSPRRERH